MLGGREAGRLGGREVGGLGGREALRFGGWEAETVETVLKFFLGAPQTLDATGRLWSPPLWAFASSLKAGLSIVGNDRNRLGRWSLCYLSFNDPVLVFGY